MSVYFENEGSNINYSGFSIISNEKLGLSSSYHNTTDSGDRGAGTKRDGEGRNLGNGGGDLDSLSDLG
jgi:hypothetical protein